MKKLLVTLCASMAILICGTANAQEEKKKDESNQYRTEKKTDPAETREDSTQMNAEHADDDQRARQEGDTTAVGSEQQESSMERSEQMNQDTTSTEESASQGSMETQRESAEGSLRSEGEIREGQSSESTTQPASGQESESSMTMAEVEVVEDKEGPEGQVVYRFNDELYYVDQTKEKKLVKAEESQLRDAKHQVKVNQSSSENARGRSKKPSKG